MTMPMPCTYEFSKGFGTGVAEALGNWGFSNRTCSTGQELQRLKCLFAKMDSLRSNKPKMCVKYDRRYDPDSWYVKPSPDECKPVWTFPSKRPLITYCSTAIILKFSDKRVVESALKHVDSGYSYVQQGVCIFFNNFNHLKRVSKIYYGSV
ncbi:uncharacterized protein [Cardiocondyla obscurior]|uniref:uncharacterized protein n=1 Tax=Cardiocondyla obscurior TaxID=286306 RepID=UPI00396575D5